MTVYKPLRFAAPISTVLAELADMAGRGVGQTFHKQHIEQSATVLTKTEIIRAMILPREVERYI